MTPATAADQDPCPTCNGSTVIYIPSADYHNSGDCIDCVCQTVTVR